MRKVCLAAALGLFACTATPQLSQAPTPSEPATAPLAAAPSSSENTRKITSVLHSPLKDVRAVSERDNRLKITVQMGYRTQQLELDKILHLKAWVEGPGLATPLYNQNDFVAVEQNTTELFIEDIPRGKHRIVTVQGYGALNDNSAETVAGATLKAVYNSPETSSDVVLDFSWRSTLEAEIIEQLLDAAGDNAEILVWLDTLDHGALNTLLDNLVYGTLPTTGTAYRIHPQQVSAQALSDQIQQNVGEIPTLNPTDTVPEAWKKQTHDFSLTVRHAGNTPFNRSQIALQLSDPASPPVSIAQGFDSATLEGAVPGEWRLSAHIAGLNGGVTFTTPVSIAPDGTTTLNLGTAANPILMPPVITGLTTTQILSNNRLTLSGDGFDANTPAQNVVQVNGETATVVSATLTELVVQLPASVGESQITVTRNGRTSNSANLTLPPRVVTLSSEQGLPGDSLTLTLAGLDPQQENTSVRFFDSQTDAEVLNRTNSSLTVRVPADARTGALTLTSSQTAPLTSPVYTLTNQPRITGLNTAGPYGALTILTILGENIADATGVTVGGVPAVIIGSVANPEERVFIELQQAAPADAQFVVTTPNGSASFEATIPTPPTIQNVTFPAQPGGDIIITGEHFNSVNRVDIAGTDLSQTDYTLVSDTELRLHTLPNNPVVGSLGITNPDGSAYTSLTYDNVVNYIGPALAAPNTQIDTPGLGNPHGIHVNRDHDIYVASLNGSAYKFGYDAQADTHSLSWVVTPDVSFGEKEDITTTPDGTVYVANTSTLTVEKITVTVDQQGNEIPTITPLAKVPDPEGLETDAQGNLYVTSTSQDETCIFKFSNLSQPLTDPGATHTCNSIKASPLTDPQQLNIEVVAGGDRRFVNEVTPQSEPIATARFDHLEGIGMDGQGRIYVVEVETRYLRRIDPNSGEVTLFADFSRGTGINTPRMTMHEIRVDRFGNVFVPSSDDGSPAKGIYLVTPNGSISLVAGNPNGLVGVNNGSPIEDSRFRDPKAVDFGPDGSLYVADMGWQGIRKIERFEPAANLQVP